MILPLLIEAAFRVNTSLQGESEVYVASTQFTLSTSLDSSLLLYSLR